MHALTAQEIFDILKARNYEKITDQNGEIWMAHKTTGRAFQLLTSDGSTYCDEVVRSSANRKSNKRRGDYWFVNRDPDICQVYGGAVELDGELYLLTISQYKISEIEADERDARLAAAGFKA